MNLQKLPYASPSWVSYGVFIVIKLDDMGML